MKFMKRKLIMTVLVLSMLAQISMNVDSFPGFHSNGDCALCHNEPGNAYNSSYATSSCEPDGEADEAFWEEYYGRRMTIPVVSSYGGNEQFVSLIFAQNDTHLFMLTSWGDPTIEGTDTERYASSDGFGIMWNINATNFNQYYSGMKTPAADEAVDTWTWKPAAAESSNDFNSSLTGMMYDNAFTSAGWADADATNDLSYGAKHGYIEPHTEEDYRLEAVRALETDDVNDVQFDHSGYYSFGIAVYNNSAGSSHYVSYIYTVYIQNGDALVTETVTEVVEETNTVDETFTETKTDTPLLSTFVVLGLMACVTAVVFVRRRK